jgi:hypothetical protein
MGTDNIMGRLNKLGKRLLLCLLPLLVLLVLFGQCCDLYATASSAEYPLLATTLRTLYHSRCYWVFVCVLSSPL